MLSGDKQIEIKESTFGSFQLAKVVRIVWHNFQNGTLLNVLCNSFKNIKVDEGGDAMIITRKGSASGRVFDVVQCQCRV